MQSGLLQLPSAAASALAMVLMGKLSGRFDARALVAMGALITVSAALLLSDINPSTSAHSLFVPLFLRGLGSVCMFLPLSLATLGDLPRDKVSSGSGFYNLMRQLGSSIGIALITTELAHREAVHRAVLVERINPANPAVSQRIGLMARAFGRVSPDHVLNHQRAMAATDAIINGQSTLLSFADVFRYVGVAFILTLPLLLLLGKGQNKAAAAAAH
jgi:DHA2 family multidrug resistance protein